MGRATGAGLAAIALFSLGIVVAGAGTFAEAKPLGRTCATRVLARATPGREATKIVGAKRLARINHVNAGLLAHELRKDPSAWVDRCGRQFYVEPRSSRGAAAAPAGTATSAAPYASDQTFKLHSLPGSSHVIYLDFTGAVISGTAWNSSGPFTAAPYDTDGDPSSFSQSEQNDIQTAWQIVAEDYAPFDIDVTTEDPGNDAISRNGSNDTTYGTRVVITDAPGPGGQNCGCGGIAYVGVFNDPNAHDFYQPAFVFYPGVRDGKTIGEAAAHEAGHTLGLHHDGTSTSGYYLGQGAWAPIMGAGYYHPITQWSRGEYANANNTEDDLAVIAAHGAPLRPDDFGNSAAAATPLAGGSTLTATGVIGSSTDTDWFSFFDLGGTTSISVTPWGVAPDLDASLSLYDSQGTRLARVDPASSQLTWLTATGLDATFSGSLTAGTYYVAVDGVGWGTPKATGYSDYASLGNYTLSITTPTSLTPRLATPKLPRGHVGAAYAAQLQAAGGTGPWTFSAGSLPPGLSLSGDGTISGQPAATFNGNLSVTVTDSLGAASTSSLPIAVTTMPTVVTTRLPDAIVGAPYRASLAASGGTAPYKWDAASSVLPAWLTLSPTGLLTGTPSTSGTFDVEPALKDADGTNVSTALAVTAVPDPGPLAITPTTLPAMTVGVPVTVRLSATGADGAVTWLLKAGQVPAGLTFSSEGVLSGTPLTAGRPRFTVQIGDGTARLAAVAYQPAIALPLQVSTTSLREGTVGTAYPTTPLRTFGGRAPFTWSVSDGALPAGLALDSTGSLSGTPSAGGDSAFTVTVVDADGRVASQALTVTARPPLQLTTDALAGATSGVAYSGQLTATGGNGVYTFRRVSGVMPPGLAIAPNGSITGTPTKVGTYSLTFSVRDSVGRSASASGQIVVASAQSPNRPPRVGRGWL